jgi:hypothetical protein
MRNKMQDLTAVSQLIHAGTDREVSSYYCDGVSMDEDYNDQRCSFEIDFDPKDEVRMSVLFTTSQKSNLTQSLRSS